MRRPRRGKSRSPKHPRRAYWEPLCKSWHLTSQTLAEYAASQGKWPPEEPQFVPGPAVARVMAAVLAAPHSSPGQLAAATSMTTAKVAEKLQRLKSQGWVGSHPEPGVPAEQFPRLMFFPVHEAGWYAARLP